MTKGVAPVSLRGRRWVRTYLVPIAVFVAAAALVSGLVLSGAVQGQAGRSSTGEAPTTVPTIIIEP